MAELNDDRTLHFLRIAASDLPRPLEDLRSRLRSPDAGAWVESELERVMLPERLLPSTLRSGGADLEVLRRCKVRATELAKSSLNARDRMAALLAHDFVVAAALLHHRTLISERPREHWDGRLVDLSVDAPEPWATFLRRAADSE